MNTSTEKKFEFLIRCIYESVLKKLAYHVLFSTPMGNIHHTIDTRPIDNSFFGNEDNGFQLTLDSIYSITVETAEESLEGQLSFILACIGGNIIEFLFSTEITGGIQDE